VYGDDIGSPSLGAAGDADDPGTDAARAGTVEHEGRGYVQSPDVVNRGFTQGEVCGRQVVYDELAVRDDYEGVDITRPHAN
jgi:hypothetical protein